MVKARIQEGREKNMSSWGVGSKVDSEQNEIIKFAPFSQHFFDKNYNRSEKLISTINS